MKRFKVTITFDDGKIEYLNTIAKNIKEIIKSHLNKTYHFDVWNGEDWDTYAHKAIKVEAIHVSCF